MIKTKQYTALNKFWILNYKNENERLWLSIIQDNYPLILFLSINALLFSNMHNFVSLIKCIHIFCTVHFYVHKTIYNRLFTNGLLKLITWEQLDFEIIFCKSQTPFQPEKALVSLVVMSKFLNFRALLFSLKDSINVYTHCLPLVLSAFNNLIIISSYSCSAT